MNYNNPSSTTNKSYTKNKDNASSTASVAEYHISMIWDNEVEVWCAVCDDIPLALESGSFDALVERVKIVAPELLEANGMSTECVLSFVSACKVEVT